MTACWVAHDIRDMIIDFIQRWAPRTAISPLQLVAWIGLSRSKYYDWKQRYGKANEHNALVPRDHWLEDWERQRIVDFHHEYPLEGYRRLTFMMLDRDLVAVSPSSAYRVLKAAGLLEGWNTKPSKKGHGFVQPLAPHEHWHIDISYLNIAGTWPEKTVKSNAKTYTPTLLILPNLFPIDAEPVQLLLPLVGRIQRR